MNCPTVCLAAGPTAGAIRSTDPVAVIRWSGGREEEGKGCELGEGRKEGKRRKAGKGRT